MDEGNEGDGDGTEQESGVPRRFCGGSEGGHAHGYFGTTWKRRRPHSGAQSSAGIFTPLLTHQINQLENVCY